MSDYTANQGNDPNCKHRIIDRVTRCQMARWEISGMNAPSTGGRDVSIKLGTDICLPKS